jgi:hypothetical protein
MILNTLTNTHVDKKFNVFICSIKYNNIPVRFKRKHDKIIHEPIFDYNLFIYSCNIKWFFVHTAVQLLSKNCE